MSSTSLTACLKVATDAAVRAGKLQASRMGRPRAVGTKRSAIDLVTEVDKASERMIARAILSRFPDHGYMGEEGKDVNPVEGGPFPHLRVRRVKVDLHAKGPLEHRRPPRTDDRLHILPILPRRRAEHDPLPGVHVKAVDADGIRELD